MNILLRWVLVLASIVLSGMAEVEPLNVMVGNLTFTRPEKWQWQPPVAGSTAAVRFVPRQSNARLTDVRLYFSGATANAVLNDWKRVFEGGQSVRATQERVKVGTCEIVYVTIKGTHTPRKGKKKPNYELFGAFVPAQNRLIQARILGPQREVHAVIPEFKKMIEDAVRDEGQHE